MEIFKNKLFLLFLAAGLVLLFSIYMRPGSPVKQDKMQEWIAQGYSKQFCSSVYPKIANCLTLQISQCLSVASKEIAICVTDRKDDIPSSATQAEAKEIYNSFKGCFARRMHNQLMQNYVVNTADCYEMMK